MEVPRVCLRRRQPAVRLGTLIANNGRQVIDWSELPGMAFSVCQNEVSRGIWLRLGLELGKRYSKLGI